MPPNSTRFFHSLLTGKAMDSTSTLTSSSTSSPQYSWSTLPSDLLSKISKTLETRIDVLSFRSVCNSWRSSVALPPQTPKPIKIPFPIGPNPSLNPNRRGHFLIVESTVYALEPLVKIRKNETKTWVIKIQEGSEPGKVILKDPFSKFTFKNLATHLPKVLNLFDYKVVEISKAHELEFVEETNISFEDFNEMKSIRIKQVAVSSSLDKVDDDSIAVMALHTGGKLAVWRMGNEKWTNIIDNRERSHYDHIGFYNGKFLAVDCNGFTLIVDPTSLEVSNVGAPVPYGFALGVQTKYLVKSLGDLFLVDKTSIADDDIGYVLEYDDDDDDHSIVLRIYKFDEEKRDWVEEHGLKDLAFFMGVDSSFYLSAKDFAGCMGNCVYFTDDSFSQINDDRPGSDAGIYDLDGDTATPLSKFPGYSKIFWPPPTWLKKNPPAS